MVAGAETTYGDDVLIVRVDDTNKDVWAEFGVRSQPAWAFVNDDGVVEVHQGSLNESRLNERIDALLAG